MSINQISNYIFQYVSKKMLRYTVYLYLENALHVSGDIITHHQERIQLYLQHLLFVTLLLLPAAIVEELKLVRVCCGWRTYPRNVSVRNEKSRIMDAEDTVGNIRICWACKDGGFETFLSLFIRKPSNNFHFISRIFVQKHYGKYFCIHLITDSAFCRILPCVFPLPIVASSFISLNASVRSKHKK
jgi:hypothetical protein